MMSYKLKIFICVVVISLGYCLCSKTWVCRAEEEPYQLNTETEDISLTDDLKIAKAQTVKYPENPEAHFNLAIALSRTSLVEEAIKELRETKKLLKREKNAGLIDKKIDEYKEILKVNPKASNIKYRLAFSHYLKAYLISKELKREEKEKKKLQAKKDKSQTNDLTSISTSKFLSIDKTYEKNPEIVKNLNLSVSYFQNLLETEPKDVWAKVYYGFILAEQMNETKKAKQLWDEVIEQDPGNPAPHFFIAEFLIKQGYLKEGVSELSKALLLRAGQSY